MTLRLQIIYLLLCNDWELEHHILASQAAVNGGEGVKLVLE